MICPKCGNQVGEKDSFCSKCGTKLNLEVEQNDVKEEKEVSKETVSSIVEKGRRVYQKYLENWKDFSLQMDKKEKMKWLIVHIITILVVGFLLMVLCSGCCLRHEWIEATCTYPRTCIKCEKTEGDVLEHTWMGATCTEPETCEVCGVTQGYALGHDWMEATCTEPATCYICWETYGDVAEHDLNSKGKCYNCGEQIGFQLNMSNYSSYIKVIFTDEGKKSDGNYYYRVKVEPLQPVKFYNVSIVMNVEKETYLESYQYSKINGVSGLASLRGLYTFEIPEEYSMTINLDTEGYANESWYANIKPKEGITLTGISHKNGGIQSITGYIVE